jgi:PhoH-like ATPase
MPKKNFILDTNVLIHDPNSLSTFKNNYVQIPVTVIEELDKFKKLNDEKGRNARIAARYIEKETQKEDSFITILFNEPEIVERYKHSIDIEKQDNRILICALYFMDMKLETTLVTKDTLLRIKGRAFNVNVEDYRNDKIKQDNQYTGHTNLYIDEKEINNIYQKGYLEGYSDFYENQCVTLVNSSNPKGTALTVFRDNKLILIDNKIESFGLKPKNSEQTYALNLLLNNDIKLVTLVGKAGTGKTLMALAAGLSEVMDEGSYEKIMVTRPIMPFQKDIGFLPGDLQEKISPWMAPIADNLDFLLNFGLQPSEKKQGKITAIEELQQTGVLQIDALTYIRGRSIPRQFILVDEAANLSALEMRTILSRVGEDTKIVLTGDPDQIDNPYLDSESNGLTYVVDKFKDQKIAAHITLTKCERSELAKIATEIL